jgi:diketogulonate reductase-like aldo/keto reductase
LHSADPQEVNVFLEEYVGRTLETNKFPRQHLFVQTKFVSLPHHHPLVSPYTPYEAEKVADACRLSFYRSLENLRTTYVDAFLIYAPELTVTPMLSLLEVLRKLKQEGRVRFTGLSNVLTVDILRHLHERVPGVIDIIQNPFHSTWDPEYKVWHYCRENGIGVHSYHTLTSSGRMLHSPIMNQIAEYQHCTPEVVLLQYCHRSGITPILGPTNQRNLEEVLLVARGVTQNLPDDHVKALSRLFAEESVINRYRAASLLLREAKVLQKKQKSSQKETNRRIKSEKRLLDGVAEEQSLVEAARARAAELAESLRIREEAQTSRAKIMAGTPNV